MKKTTRECSKSNRLVRSEIRNNIFTTCLLMSKLITSRHICQNNPDQKSLSSKEDSDNKVVDFLRIGI